MDWRSISKNLGRARKRSHRAQRTLLGLGLLAACTLGCNTQRYLVRPNEREYLADRIMRPAGDPQEAAAEEHVLTSREGAIGGRGTAGGGCGCN